MTGFARVEGGAGAIHWALEAKSVNGKSLELRVRLPPGFEWLESPLRQAAQKALARGNVQVNLQLDRGETRARLTVNQAVLDELLSLARRLQSEGAAPPSADGLLALKGVLETQEEAEDEAAVQARERALAADAERLFAALAEVRQREGAALRATLLGHLDTLAGLVTAAAAGAAAQPAALRQRLATAMDELLGASPALSEERLAQEVALLVLKGDVREELDRLTAHLAEARRLIEGGGAIGRKLDFLCQELNREANTLCSKSPDLELTRIGLEMKGTVDQIREQVQNVE
jgi:uncharacterized protein (TIGR00255 family)